MGHNGAMTRDDLPQNIYDDPRFFAGYSQLERFQSGWGGAMEHGPFLALVGELSGRRALDLGCGAGQLSFYLASAGASAVLAIDASARMLDVARARSAHPRVTYRRLTMEAADFPAASFDLVVSSLALHYVEDYAGLVSRIARWLTPGGRLVFSTEHPIYTARPTADGWQTDATGRHLAWSLDDYAEEGPREHEWFVPGVRRYHRTLATLLNGLIDAGLIVQRVVEPAPDEAWLRQRPEHADERRRPMFLLVGAGKP
jgi:2-polyprenyl-3-methyl-5-hydroxy-6-metoxy-1,4-benzoquinol methylase